MLAFRIIPILMALALLPLVAQGSKMYRWTDDEGNTHYTDKIPPEYASKERTMLNARGIEVGRIEAAKTKEEKEREAALERLRAEQKRMIEKQKAADRVLLRTFRSEDDILMARDGKISAIDAQILVTRGNIKHLKQKLLVMQKNAANLERQGEKVSERYLADMNSVQQQIESGYASIISKERHKEAIREKHAEDLERFRKLKKLATNDMESRQEEQITATLLETVVPCADNASCDATWKRAEAYVREHATTRIQMLSDSIVMTAPPGRDDDCSLTLSRIRYKGQTQGAEIFMDLQCKNTTRGDEFCKGPKVRAIRSNFRAAVSPPPSGD